MHNYQTATVVKAKVFAFVCLSVTNICPEPQDKFERNLQNLLIKLSSTADYLLESTWYETAATTNPTWEAQKWLQLDWIMKKLLENDHWILHYRWLTFSAKLTQEDRHRQLALKNTKTTISQSFLQISSQNFVWL